MILKSIKKKSLEELWFCVEIIYKILYLNLKNYKIKRFELKLIKNEIKVKYSCCI